MDSEFEMECQPKIKFFNHLKDNLLNIGQWDLDSIKDHDLGKIFGWLKGLTCEDLYIQKWNAEFLFLCLKSDCKSARFFLVWQVWTKYKRADEVAKVSSAL